MLSFGYFSLHKQRKVTRGRAASGMNAVSRIIAGDLRSPLTLALSRKGRGDFIRLVAVGVTTALTLPSPCLESRAAGTPLRGELSWRCPD